MLWISNGTWIFDAWDVVAVAEPLEHVRTWNEWFSQMYDYMLRVGERICATASSAFDAVKGAVKSAVNSFMELLQRRMESMSSFFHSINIILQELVNAIFAIFPAYTTHAHHT
jgi:phage-related protein